MAISNNSTGLRPGVCTSSTRPTAPYEGQMIYETDTDKTLFWDGSAWANVNSVSPAFTGTPTAPTATAGTNTTQLATTAFANTAGGLVYLSSTAVGSGVSTVTISNCFNSTYDTYKVVYTGGTANVNGAIFFAMNGSPAGWYGNLIYSNFVSGSVASVGIANATSLSYGGSVSGGIPQVNVDVQNPFLTIGTFVTSHFIDAANAGTCVGVHGVTTSYTGFVLTVPGGGAFTGGTITIYGYRK